jgi:hypothetical protein
LQKFISRRGSNKVESFFSQANGLFEGNNISHELAQAVLMLHCLKFQLAHRAARAGLPKPVDCFPWLGYEDTALRASVGLPVDVNAPRPPPKLARSENFGLSGYETLESWSSAPGSDVTNKASNFMPFFHNVSDGAFTVDVIPQSAQVTAMEGAAQQRQTSDGQQHVQITMRAAFSCACLQSVSPLHPATAISTPLKWSRSFDVVGERNARERRRVWAPANFLSFERGW